jgi:hypothetical protein
VTRAPGSARTGASARCLDLARCGRGAATWAVGIDRTRAVAQVPAPRWPRQPSRPPCSGRRAPPLRGGDHARRRSKMEGAQAPTLGSDGYARTSAHPPVRMLAAAQAPILARFG